MKALSIIALIGILWHDDVARVTCAELTEEDVDKMTETEYKNYLMRQ